MARGINKVILVGNLGADPEVRYSQGGAPVAKFRVATSESWKNRETGSSEERTEWHSIVAFNRLAEIVGEYLRKGSKVYVEGSLRTSDWEVDGQKRYRTEIVARELQMLDSRGAGGGMGGPQEGGGAQRGGARGRPAPASDPFEPARAGAGPEADDFDDDIPF